MRPKTQTITRLDYCQYLLVSQINYTLTNFADHSEKFSHDALNRYMAGERLQPKLTWENVKDDVVQTPKGFVVFDDTIADKNFSHEIELVRRQYSGNAQGVIKGIGIVTCVYVHPALDQFWIIDYRIYDPDGDGKTKLDHVQDMLLNCVHQKQLLFWAVLMDSWYATKEIMLAIEKYGKIYYCPLKANRQVDDSSASQPYRRVDRLEWTETEKQHGKVIKIKGFPGNHKVKLFRVVLSAYGEAHGLCCDQRHGARQHAGRTRGVWLSLEGRAVSPRNQAIDWIGRLPMSESQNCSKSYFVCYFGWVRLKQVANETQQTVYRLKHGLLSDYLRQQLKSPAIQMTFA